MFRTVTGEGLFAVTSGACTVASDATCFHSPSYPANYSNYQQCTIIVHEDVTLSVTAFSTELWYDYLTVNGEQYDGTSGPEGVHVAAGSTIYFASDGAVTSSGFEICGAPPMSVKETTNDAVNDESAGEGSAGNRIPRVWKAATSKAEPRQQQDWILKCVQGGRAHPLAACGVATLCCSPPAMLETDC